MNTKKNLLFISYGEFEYDGRLRELYRNLTQLFNVFAITRGEKRQDENHTLLNFSYTKFISKAVKKSKEYKNIDFIFMDNRKATIPGMLIKKHFKNSKTILDCRELYISKYVKHIRGKIGCFFEKKCIKKSDIVICANKERSEYMKEYFKLNDYPIVFENIRALTDCSPQERVIFEKKYSRFDNDEIKLLSTSGCDLSRKTYELVNSLKHVNYNVRLFLVGDSDLKDIKVINSLINKEKLNVEIIGRVKQDELKFIIDFCDIGVVSYHQNDMNNKFCASGKVYEFMYEGKPIVATTNPPLKSICNQYGVGECDNNFFGAINKVIANYQEYKKNIDEFLRHNNIQKNNELFLRELDNRIKTLN